ncbi:MAG: formylglycine-generating enzyme family protein [Desulfobacula sp.]|jgi:formylglycine-generating enzyme required for sulfatase activity|nr:formylglycine-generating enzyme family protein [Desulfobacula sp.]
MNFSIFKKFIFYLLVIVVLSICFATNSFSSSLAPIDSVFEQKRSNAEDVIYFRNKDVLRGKVVNQGLNINTPYGLIQVPVKFCAGVSFEGSRSNTEAIVTTNYNRLTGILTDRIIKFQIGTSGNTIQLRKEKIKFILFQKEKKESSLLDTNRASDLYIMSNGDLLTGKTVEKNIIIGTDYADIPVAFFEIKSIQMQGGDNVTAVVKKTNGDVMRGTLATEKLTLNLDLSITVEAVYKDKFSRIYVGDGIKQVAGNFGALQPVSGESDGAQFSTVSGDATKNSIGMEFKLINPGSFMMGSPRNEANRDDDEVQHKVTLTKSFYMQTTEVTQAQWYSVMGSNPSRFSNCGGDCPVEEVSWDDVQQFIINLNEKENTQKYRLPTEAEWEYASRAGASTAYCYGDSPDQLVYYGWFGKNSGGKTHPVAQKKVNKWGLYDMHGNVYEWCLDWNGNYPPGAEIDPKGPSSEGTRVSRGGSWSSNARSCRSADRYGLTPDYRNYRLGFRLVLVPAHQVW